MRCSQPASPRTCHSASVQKVTCDRGEPEFAAGLRQRPGQHGRRHAPDQQARARHRAERRGHLQFRIVLPAGPLEGRRPAMVEDVFAVAVRLRVHRRRPPCTRPSRIAQGGVLRQPARARMAERLSSTAERKACETNGLPAPAQASHSAAEISPMAECRVSVSVGVPSGMTLKVGAPRVRQCGTCPPLPPPRRRAATGTPMVVRACRPASPNTATARSEAPFITWACPVKAGGAAMKPPSRTTCCTRSRSPVAGGLEVHQDVDEAKPRGLLALLDGQRLADLAGDRDLAVGRRHLAADHHQVAGAHERHVVGDRRHRRGQGDAEFLKFRLNPASHCHCFPFYFPTTRSAPAPRAAAAGGQVERQQRRAVAGTVADRCPSPRPRPGDLGPAEVIRGEVAEHVVEQPGRTRHGRVALHGAGGAEAGEGEGLDELRQRHAVLQARLTAMAKLSIRPRKAAPSLCRAMKISPSPPSAYSPVRR